MGKSRNLRYGGAADQNALYTHQGIFKDRQSDPEHATDVCRRLISPSTPSRALAAMLSLDDRSELRFPLLDGGLLFVPIAVAPIDGHDAALRAGHVVQEAFGDVYRRA